MACPSKDFHWSLTAEGNLVSGDEEETCQRTGCGGQIRLGNFQQPLSFFNIEKLLKHFFHSTHSKNASP